MRHRLLVRVSQLFLPPAWGGAIGLLVVAAAIRLVFARWSGLPFESDEAIVGLMARHILWGGERPLFYYGQSYLGPLEPFSVAAIFAVLGPSVTALRLAPLGYSLVFLGLTTGYSWRQHGSAAGLATLAYLGVPPLFLLTWSVKARGGYAELLALGALILLLVAQLGDAPAPRIWRWVVLGAASGLALWTDPLALVYLVPSALYLVVKRGRQLADWRPLLGCLALLLISAPMLLDNLRSRGATFRELAGANGTTNMSFLQYRQNLVATIHDSLPILVGLSQASSNRQAFLEARTQAIIPAALATAVAIALAAGLALLLGRSAWRLRRGTVDPDDLLLWVAAATLALFCVSEAEVLFLSEPRYLLPIYAATPVLAGLWSKCWRRQGALAVALVTVAITLNLGSVLSFRPDLAAPHLDGQVVDAGSPQLASFVAAHQVSWLYTDYWLAYPLAFQSGEQIVPSVVDSQLAVGFNRYIPYAVAVDQATDPAILVVAGGPTEERLVARLRATGRRYRVSRWQNLDLYDQITPPLRPASAVAG